MGKGQNKTGHKHKSINLPKRRCMQEGCNKVAKCFEYENNKIKLAFCKLHRR